MCAAPQRSVNASERRLKIQGGVFSGVAMVQFRDIFPALLLVGCAGKTVLFCRLLQWEPCAFCWWLLASPPPRCKSFIVDRGGVHPACPGRSSGVLFSGCGGSPGPPPALISLLACLALICFCFVFCFLFFVLK